MKIHTGLGLIGFTLFLVVAGCQKQGDQTTGTNHQDSNAAVPNEPGKADDDEADIRSVRAELSPEDQQLVEAQDFCPIMPDKRLGVMGAPIKVTIKDQPVFLCCKGCRRKALADPDKTLAKVEGLKAKVKAGAEKK